MDRKPWYKSLTAVGAVLFGAVNGAEAAGVVPPGASQSFAELVNALAQVLVILGVRRAIKPDVLQG